MSKTRRNGRNGATGDFTVSGSDGQWPSLGAAISAAHTRVSADLGEEYRLRIFEKGEPVALVESHQDRTITTSLTNGGAR